MAHGDDRASLHVDEGTDGRLCLHHPFWLHVAHTWRQAGHACTGLTAAHAASIPSDVTPTPWRPSVIFDRKEGPHNCDDVLRLVVASSRLDPPSSSKDVTATKFDSSSFGYLRTYVQHGAVWCNVVQCRPSTCAGGHVKCKAMPVAKCPKSVHSQIGGHCH